MSNTIKIKRGSGAPTSLAYGELGWDKTNKALYIGDSDGNSKLVGAPLPLSIANGGTGNATGLAASATKLATARTIMINLASTSVASFNGTANITPGVRGILPVAHGGTGVGSAVKAGLAYYNLGSFSGKTVADLQTALDDWLADYYTLPNASCYFTCGSSWITCWNNKDTTTELEAGLRFTVTLVGSYSNSNYTCLKLYNYNSGIDYTVAKYNGTWGKMYKTTTEWSTPVFYGAKSLTDADLLDELADGKSGKYYGSNITNAPDTGWWHIDTNSSGSAYASITAINYAGTKLAHTVYRNGTLNDWTIINNPNYITGLTGNVQEQLDSKTSIELLWENASPSTSLASGATITLAQTGYAFLIVIGNWQTGNESVMPPTILLPGKTSFLNAFHDTRVCRYLTCNTSTENGVTLTGDTVTIG